MTPRPAADALPRLLRAAQPGGLTVRRALLASDVQAGAMFSPCDRYRYLLWRVWDASRPWWTFGMLNPSTADEARLDPTVTRCVNRAKAGGAGGLVVWNLFAWRDTDPAGMKRAAQPVGEHNDVAILRAVADAAVNVAGWGAHGRHLGRAARVRRLLALANVPLHVLGFTHEFEPRHPLYIRAETPPQPWRYPREGA